MADLTVQLQRLAEGDAAARDAIAAAVYDDVRAIAARHLKAERPGHTLQPTALANEVFCNLIRQEVAWQNRAHFFAVAAMAVRRVLVDHARARARLKRGGGAARADVDAEQIASDQSGLSPEQVLELDDALARLRALSPRQAEIVEMKFFAGLEMKDIAEALGVSLRTVEADWTMARAWLRREMTGTQS